MKKLRKILRDTRRRLMTMAGQAWDMLRACCWLCLLARAQSVHQRDEEADDDDGDKADSHAVKECHLRAEVFERAILYDVDGDALPAEEFRIDQGANVNYHYDVTDICDDTYTISALIYTIINNQRAAHDLLRAHGAIYYPLRTNRS